MILLEKQRCTWKIGIIHMKTASGRNLFARWNVPEKVASRLRPCRLRSVQRQSSYSIFRVHGVIGTPPHVCFPQGNVKEAKKMQVSKFTVLTRNSIDDCGATSKWANTSPFPVTTRNCYTFCLSICMWHSAGAREGRFTRQARYQFVSCMIEKTKYWLEKYP